MKKGLIAVNAYSRLASSLNQAERLKAEFSSLGAETEIIANNKFSLYVSEAGKIVDRDLDFGFCIYLDKDKYVARMLEKRGVKLFNSSASIETCDDKMLTHIALADNGIPMPATVPGLLCYTPEANVPQEVFDYLEEFFGYPVIIKESYGSLGKGVYKADDRAGLKAVCEKLKCVPHLFQKFAAESAGRDVRVIVIGGECVCAMQRLSDGDFRSNIELGGRGEPFEIDEKLADICGRTAKILGLDYCGIDVLRGKNGYLVCEVNSNAFFGGIERVTGVNVAKRYAEYVLSELK